MKRRWGQGQDDPRAKRQREYQNYRGFHSDFSGPSFSSPRYPHHIQVYHPLQTTAQFQVDPFVNNFMGGPHQHVRFGLPERPQGANRRAFYDPQNGLTHPSDNEHRVLRYLSLSSLCDTPIPQIGEKNRGGYARLSADIRNSFLEERQCSRVFERKVLIWRKMDDLVAKNLPGAFLQVFGSTLNGFGGKESDMDLGLFLDLDRGATFMQRQKTTADRIKTILHKLKRMIVVQLSANIYPDIEMIPAKVPILKMREKHWNTEIDIACNHPIGVRNTHLLFQYSQMDWRIAPLVHAVKLWAKSNQLNEAKNGTFSSYTLTLMVLHVLQHVVQPPVIPSLQRLAPDAFHHDSDITSLNFERVLPQYASSNRQTLGELLARFFQYYGRDFDFTQHVPSVRTGGVLTNTDCEAQARQQRTPVGQWKAYICVEEPFERTNAARAICRRDAFDEILAALTKAWDKLAQKNASVTLASILGSTS